MNTFRVVASLIAFAPLTAAIAGDPAPADANAESVAKLKSHLSNTMGFKVDDVRMTGDGVACISYRISNDYGGESHAKAVVEGEKVLRSTSRTQDFANAWNSKCAGGANKPAGA
jgi:hypothetical protein